MRTTGSGFSTINAAAVGFGVLFVAEGLFLVYLAAVRTDVLFEPTRDARGFVGGLLIVYALVLYPLIGGTEGHAYPAQPTFGVPCPTTIFTIGVLLWGSRVSPLRR